MRKISIALLQVRLTLPTNLLQQQPISPDNARKHPVNVMLDTSLSVNVVLPPELQPGLGPISVSRNAAQFYMPNAGKTGVLALGSSSDKGFFELQLVAGYSFAEITGQYSAGGGCGESRRNPASRFIDLSVA
jgi:hypothetical protein